MLFFQAYQIQFGLSVAKERRGVVTKRTEGAQRAEEKGEDSSE
jgi:hypothetical protein